MSQPHKRFRLSIWRFSLRSLLLVVTALCVFFGYELEWIRRRHAFVDEQTKLFNTTYQNDDPRKTQQDFMREWRKIRNFKPKRAPYLLWLFNEQGYGQRPVLLTDGVSRRETGSAYVREVRYYTSRSHPTLVKGRRLFPEAEVIPFVNNVPDGITIFWEVIQE